MVEICRHMVIVGQLSIIRVACSRRIGQDKIRKWKLSNWMKASALHFSSAWNHRKSNAQNREGVIIKSEMPILRKEYIYIYDYVANGLCAQSFLHLTCIRPTMCSVFFPLRVSVSASSSSNVSPVTTNLQWEEGWDGVLLGNIVLSWIVICHPPWTEWCTISASCQF